MLKLIKIIKSAYEFTTDYVVAFLCPNESCWDRAKNLSASSYFGWKGATDWTDKCFTCNTEFNAKPVFDMARKSGIFDDVAQCYGCSEYFHSRDMFLKQPNKAESIEETIDGVLWGRVPLRDYCEECINWIQNPEKMAREYEAERAYSGDYEEIPPMHPHDYQMELHIQNGGLGDYYESDGNGNYWRKEEPVKTAEEYASENKAKFLKDNLDESIRYKKFRDEHFV